MLIGKKEFIAGMLMATIAVSAATKLTSLYATSSKISSEVEFSQRIGLFDSERLSDKTLRSNIAEIAFYRGLNLILANKGMVEGFNTANLEALGITNTTAPMSSITRQKAAETIMRALIHAQSKGSVVIPEANKKVAFRDWIPEDKYQNVAAFAVSKGILKGTGKNLFKPLNKLSVKEALVFLRRLHEIETKPVNFKEIQKHIWKPAVEKQAVTKESKEENLYVEPDLSTYFKDIDSASPMAKTIKKLINAGAFDVVQLNQELHLPKSIKNGEFAGICKSMLKKAGKQELSQEIDKVLSSTKADEAINRNTVAKMGAVMIKAYAHKDYNIQAKYTDVSANTDVDTALKSMAKAGIRMGYPDGSFKGKEKISRFEAFSLLNIILGDSVDYKTKVKPAESKVKKAGTPAKASPNKKKLTKSEKQNIKSIENRINQEQASMIEQQLSQQYKGLSFRERIELRKEQFRKILNHESVR